MMGGRRGRIGVNKEDAMWDEIEILKFLSDQNDGRCTHEHFNSHDRGPSHLATSLLELIRSGYVKDNNCEYILTEIGRTRLADLISMA